MNPLRIVLLCLTLAGFAAGMIAAFWWYRASEVRVDPAWSKREGGFEPVDALQSQAGRLAGRPAAGRRRLGPAQPARRAMDRRVGPADRLREPAGAVCLSAGRRAACLSIFPKQAEYPPA